GGVGPPRPGLGPRPDGAVPVLVAAGGGDGQPDAAVLVQARRPGGCRREPVAPRGGAGRRHGGGAGLPTAGRPAGRGFSAVLAVRLLRLTLRLIGTPGRRRPRCGEKSYAQPPSAAARR